MASQPIPPSSSDDESIAQSILTDWLNETASFYYQYNTLTHLVSQRRTEQATQPDSHTQAWQYSTDALESLASVMEAELEKLVCDLEQADSGTHPGAEQTNEKLLAHTITLSRLNRRARLLIQLASSPSS